MLFKFDGMSELRKANTGYSYFLTITVVGWIDVFTRRIYCEKVVESLKYCVQNKGLDIFAYVIMPSHIHLVARSLKGNLNEIIRDFKSYTAKELIKIVQSSPDESRKDWLVHMFRYHANFQKQNADYMFWQKTNHPIELNYPRIVDQKVDYIHNNPVVAGHVTEAQAWYFSSANPMSPLSVLQA
jgi:REP element-mobilizing transposase RayT